MIHQKKTQVALRKESVDRNAGGLFGLDSLFASLSARRAWIEIGYFQRRLSHRCVALRKESVDRNHDDMLRYRDAEQSLSARRAWIEIDNGTYHPHFHVSLSARRAWIEINYIKSRIYDRRIVALRKESVDRNSGGWGRGPRFARRSPQGERG